jgi:hypothetical protein
MRQYHLLILPRALKQLAVRLRTPLYGGDGLPPGVLALLYQSRCARHTDAVLRSPIPPQGGVASSVQIGLKLSPTFNYKDKPVFHRFHDRTRGPVVAPHLTSRG